MTQNWGQMTMNIRHLPLSVAIANKRFFCWRIIISIHSLLSAAFRLTIDIDSCIISTNNVTKENINMYKILDTREDFYEYIKDDISFNVFDMSDGEVDITARYCKLVKFFQNLDFSLPQEKEKLDIIVFAVKRNFEKCLHYILIPDNNAAYLKLRILTENLVLLKFLLTSDSAYTEKWSKWSYLRLSSELRANKYGQEITAFELRLREEYNATEGNKPKFEQLINNNYGWTFPAIKSHINFQRIAEYCNESEVYDKFVRYSAEVHTNTSSQSWQSRFEHMTYQLVLDAAQLMDIYISLLLDYTPKINVAEFMRMYDNIIDITSSYLDDYYAKIKQIII